MSAIPSTVPQSGYPLPGTNPQWLTFQDAVTHGLDFLGADAVTEPALRACRRAAIEAFRQITNARTWAYLYHQGRIVTSTMYSTGTIQYTHTGGLYERLLTLTGGVWPTWADQGGNVRIDVGLHRVDRRIDDTNVQLDAQRNPGADVAAGTSYSILRDDYLLPPDFIEIDTPLAAGNWGGLEYVHPTSMVWESRLAITAGIARYFTILGSDRYPGRLIVRFSPHPDIMTLLDFIYHRRPAAMTIVAVNVGSATMAQGSNTVTGSGTAWTPTMVGSILRLSADSNVPTGPGGLYPAAFESVITAFVSATELRVADPADRTYTAVKSEVSDRVDIEAGAIQTAYLRGIEAELVIGRRLSLEARPNAVKAYDMALREAKAADSRSFQGRVMGQGGRKPMNPIYFPKRFF